MSAKWLLFSRPVFFAILMHYAVFSTLIHTSKGHNGTMVDRLALLAIKSMIKDDPQGVMTSWNDSNTNFCQWQGVTCGGRHKRVTLLDLSSGDFSGTLSPSIGNLSFLRWFWLTNNSFFGEIPSEIGRLFNLRGLFLQNNSFTGNIPNSIMNCSNLQFLDLGYNNLVGKIPDGIGSLSMLNMLMFNENILEGGIPHFVTNLTLLETLYLGGCQLSGSLPDMFHSSTNLKRLDMFGNNLTGIIPPSLYNCSSLEQVVLYDNQLTGRIPKNLGSKMPRLVLLLLSQNHIQGNFLDIPATLEILDLSSNNIWGELPSLSNNSSLKILALSDNFFAGSLHNLVCLNGLNMTRALDLGHNHLSGEIPECWEKWPSLYFLNLESNYFSGEIPGTLGSLSSLTYLNTRRNKFKGNLTKLFRKLAPNLTLLDMSENHFQGTLPLFCIPKTLKVVELSSNEFWGSLHPLLCSNGTKGISALNLGNNQFSGVIPECWEKWPSLVVLDLQNNRLSGEIPRTLGFMTSLQQLNMRGNKIFGKIPSSLMNLSNIKILQLGRNELFGNIPTWIGTKLTFLRILNLRSNKFNGSIPYELCYLSHVQILDLANNNLSGNIPRCFNNFSVLSGIETKLEVQFSFSLGGEAFIASDSLVMKGREDTYTLILGLVMLLDLSSNNFSGQIPNELTHLHELKSLNVSRNQLAGYVPDKIGDMKSLESFDISLNKLSGELPMSLSNLNFISIFNVSYNNFIGRVPTSTQIQSLNESNFVGNKLCGAPLTSECKSLKEPDTDKDEQEDNGSHGTDWGLVTSIVLGFISGFWMIFASLIVNKSWRIAYFRLLSKWIKVCGV